MSALEKIKTRLDKETESLNMLDLSEIHITNISEEIKKVLERFKKVKVLILKHCDLDSLENLPNWKLTAIDLS
jgi:DNA integrity scanning protein DisA with diadenylate cyclase activity